MARFLFAFLQSEVILETEDSVRYRRGTFSLQKVKKGTPNLIFPYAYSLFTIIFEKYELLRAAFGIQT